MISDLEKKKRLLQEWEAFDNQIKETKVRIAETLQQLAHLETFLYVPCRISPILRATTEPPRRVA